MIRFDEVELHLTSHEEGIVTDRDESSVTIRREMTPGGSYDALGIERLAGDSRRMLLSGLCSVRTHGPNLCRRLTWWLHE